MFFFSMVVRLSVAKEPAAGTLKSKNLTWEPCSSNIWALGSLECLLGNNFMQIWSQQMGMLEATIRTRKTTGKRSQQPTLGGGGGGGGEGFYLHHHVR